MPVSPWPRNDFRTPRLYVEDALGEGASVQLSKPQAHYLCNVLRLKPGDGVLAFNGRDGEWRTVMTLKGRRDTALVAEKRLREQPRRPTCIICSPR